MELPTTSALIPGLRPAAAPASGRVAAASDFDTFLKLLTAQLRNQDPLQPLESTQFVAQLASFSTVEQLIGANERIDTLTSQSLAGDVASLSGWLGRDVVATDGSFRATGGPVGFAVPPLAGAERIEAIVSDADGKIRDRFTVVADQTGASAWNGSDVPAGTDLALSLHYLADDTVMAERPGLVFRTVTGIRGTAEGAVLDLADGASLAPDKVGELRQRPADPG